MTMTPEQYLDAVDLSNLPRPVVAMDGLEDLPLGTIFDEARQQAQLVGSGVFSFAAGVEVPVREAMSDSLLLAQLVANKNAKDGGPLAWFKEYVSVFGHLGWTITGDVWTDHTVKGTDADFHQEALGILTAVLGPGAAALSIITASIKALQAMEPTSKWIRIFDRESRTASIARFQLGAVEQDAAGTVTISMLACVIEARHTVTQVLVFRFGQANATFKATGPRFTSNRAALAQLQPKVRAKVVAFQDAFLGSITDL